MNRIMKLSSRLFRTLAAATAFTLAACASTELVNQWSNPAYTSPSFKKVMVIGVTKQASIRRTFEDEFVAQLKAAGVNAIPSYRISHRMAPLERRFSSKRSKKPVPMP